MEIKRLNEKQMAFGFNELCKFKNKFKYADPFLNIIFKGKSSKYNEQIFENSTYLIIVESKFENKFKTL